MPSGLADESPAANLATKSAGVAPALIGKSFYGAAAEAANGRVSGSRTKMTIEELVAPVPEEMRAKLPGHELLMPPEQRHLLLHRRPQNSAENTDAADHRRRIYSVKDTWTGLTLLVVKEVPEARWCLPGKFRSWRSLHFEVTSMSSHQEKLIGHIDSEAACEPCCCGTFCLVPVCCCMRSATWWRSVPSEGGQSNGGFGPGELGRPVATASAAWTMGDCGLARKIDAATFDNANVFSLCSGSRKRWGPSADGKLATHRVVDAEHPWAEPLARIWDAVWVNDYEPTNERFAMLSASSNGGLTAAEKQAIDMRVPKTMSQDCSSDSRTYLLELPHDSAKAKVALLTALIVYDNCWEPSPRGRSGTGLRDENRHPENRE